MAIATGYSRYRVVLTDADKNKMVTILKPGGGNATGLVDRYGGAMSNPMSSGPFGVVEFFGPSGRYALQIGGVSILETFGQQLTTRDLADFNATIAAEPSGGGGGAGGISQSTLDATIATLQEAATAATDSELAAAVATFTSALTGKQDASSAATDAELAAAVATINAAAATDTELANAVSSLTSQLSAKQDASTAATDTEVSSAVATLNTALTGKQDAASAATDAEVAAAVATINSGLALKQDAATAATDAELAAAVGGRATKDFRYVNGGSYTAGQVAVSGGQFYMATSDFTAAGAFNSSEPWLLLGSQETARAPLSTVTAATATSTAVTGWQIVVPANSGPQTLKVVNATIAYVTGSLAANTSISAELRIMDELGAQVCISKDQINSTGTSQTHVRTMFVEYDIANFAIPKTYTVFWRGQNAGVSSATVTIHTSASGFTDPALKAVRR